MINFRFHYDTDIGLPECVIKNEKPRSQTAYRFHCLILKAPITISEDNVLICYYYCYFQTQKGLTNPVKRRRFRWIVKPDFPWKRKENQNRSLLSVQFRMALLGLKSSKRDTIFFCIDTWNRGRITVFNMSSLVIKESFFFALKIKTGFGWKNYSWCW